MAGQEQDLVMGKGAVVRKSGHQGGDPVYIIHKILNHIIETITGTSIQGRKVHHFRNRQIQLHFEERSKTCLGICKTRSNVLLDASY